MAITINEQRPTSPRYSYGEIVYTVSSDLVGPSIDADDIKQEYSFVVDVKIGSVIIQTIRKQPNPVGVGNFDLSDIINNNLDYDLAAVGATLNYPAVDARKRFTAVFGEEFIDSNGDLVVHTGAAGTPVAGSPSVGAPAITVIKGVDEYDTIELGDASTVPSVLTQMVNTRLHRDDYYAITTSSSSQVITHNRVTVPSTGASFDQVIAGVTYSFDVYDDKSILGETRFAWFNTIGGIEYFTADQEGTSSTSVDKSSYNSTTINYGVTTPNNKAGNTFISRNRVYAVDYDQTFTKNTRWLTEDEALALEGLFDSPHVYVQDGDNFRPVEITNAYESYSAQRNQQLFQYTINYRFSNGKRNI